MMSLDVGKLKPNGSHYVAVSFRTDYCISLPNDNYEVKLEFQGRELVVQIVLENIEQKIELSDLSSLSHIKKQYYSFIVVYIPVRMTDLIANQDYKIVRRFVYDQYPRYRELAVEAINKLVSVYRFMTSETHIKPVIGQNHFSLILLFNQESPTVQKSTFIVTGKNYTTTENLLPLISTLPSTIIQDLRNKLLELVYQIPLAEELILNAYEFLSKGNLRLSVIEAETGFEVAVIQFLLRKYDGDDEITSKIKREKSFTKLLKANYTIEAFAKIKKSFLKEDKYYVEWDNNVWKLRGAVVHGRIATVTHDECTQALQTIEETLEYLFDRPPTKLGQYMHYKID